MKPSSPILVLTLCAALIQTQAAQAVPFAPTAARTATAGLTTNVHIVDYRRGYGYRRGRNVGLGIAAAIIGGVVIANATRSNGYYERRHRGSGAAQRCADTYRSFDWQSGTYLGYDGDRHVCPYL